MNEPLTLASLKTDLERGIAVAMDPANERAIQSGGEATTTLQSHWLHELCPVCAHTFRVGDDVFIDDAGTTRHNTAQLPCAQQGVTTIPQSWEMTGFFSGLDEVWPSPEITTRLRPGHSLLAPPHAGFKRRTCAVCGHTLRPYDQVVICPCSPNQPLCQTAIHRDVLHGLHCLEAWNPGANKQKRCPVTFWRLDE